MHKLLNRFFAVLFLAGSAIASTTAVAVPISCGDAERTATLGSAEACVTSADIGSSNGNPKAEDLLEAFPSDPWTKLGDVDVTFTTGGFDATSVDLDWSLGTDIWSDWEEVVVTIHVGNGRSDLTWFAWLITPGEVSGFLDYDRISGGGGGFSNIKAWGRGEVAVPEPGTLALLGTGLVAVGFLRRRKRV